MKLKMKPSSNSNAKSLQIQNKDRQTRSIIHLCHWLWLLLVVASTSAGTAGDYVLVVDTSGSMRDRVSSRDSRMRIGVVENAMREYLPGAPTIVADLLHRLQQRHRFSTRVNFERCRDCSKGRCLGLRISIA